MIPQVKEGAVNVGSRTGSTAERFTRGVIIQGHLRFADLSSCLDGDRQRPPKMSSPGLHKRLQAAHTDRGEVIGIPIVIRLPRK